MIGTIPPRVAQLSVLDDIIVAMVRQPIVA
jgi:hypothetical protein